MANLVGRSTLDYVVGSMTLGSLSLLCYSMLQSTKASKKKKKKANRNKKGLSDETKHKKTTLSFDSDFEIALVMSSFLGFDAHVGADKKNKDVGLKYGSKLIKINNENCNDLSFEEIYELLQQTKKQSKKENKKIKLTFIENDKLNKDWIKAEQLKEEANKLYQTNQNDKAIEKVTKAIELHNTNKMYYSNRVLMYLKAKKFDLALNDCYKIRELDPKSLYIKGHYLRGLVLLNQKKYLQSIDAFQTVFKLSPSFKAAESRLTASLNMWKIIQILNKSFDSKKNIVDGIIQFIDDSK